jgi:hypothetical protein
MLERRTIGSQIAIAGAQALFDENDQFALANNENPWSVDLEQVGHGLL